MDESYKHNDKQEKPDVDYVLHDSMFTKFKQAQLNHEVKVKWFPSR
jgi:hypothetical protein